ncbi:MAG TPA: pyruvate formate lyase-activating protein [Clostridiales bacterium]|nr:pyruvate formate lyase-activating protein [Clostridiales bacterium]
MTGRIHSYETLGAADGPGLRFVLFLQGCGLRCLYCHNPDTWNPCGGKTVSAEEIAGEVVRYRNYFGRRGGFTASGGEPLLQLEFLCELFGRLKVAGISTVLDTSGAPYRAEDRRYDELLSVTDLVLLDIKHIDDAACHRLTGHGNAATLAFAERLSRDGVPMWIRQVLVPEWTDREEDLRRTRQWIDSLSTVERVEVLPYHTLGKSKYEKLCLPYPLEGIPTPDANAVRRAEKILFGDPECTSASRKKENT